MRIVIGIITTMLCATSTLAHNFGWLAQVDSVQNTGFHNILIKPEVNATMKPDFSDIRIYDRKGRETPYFLQTEAPLKRSRIFREYKVVALKHLRHYSYLILENQAKNKINNISLIIKNFDVRKRLELSGSDDQRTWYTIKEDYTFHSVYDTRETSEIKILNFPYSDYRYYRILIYDVFTMPINIVRAGYYDTYLEMGKYQKLENPKFTQKDSVQTKESFIRITFPSTPYMDKLVFKLKVPHFYRRQARICSIRKTKKGREYLVTERHFEISSNEEHAFSLNKFDEKDFYLVVRNDDNPPLEFLEIEGYQLNHYLTAYLENGNQYHIRFGDEKARSPVYDLNYFRDSIPNKIPMIQTSSIISEADTREVSVRAIPRVYIWVAIGIIVLLLGFMSTRMLREMKSN